MHHPFPLLLIDDFLDVDVAEGLLAEFLAPDSMPKSRDYMFGEKRELSSVAEQGPTSKAFYDALLSDEFKEFIGKLTGKDLFVDPAFHGGGFHQSGDGGFLDTHVDFNMHPLHPDWLRTLNILVYLNKDWKKEYDGRLMIKASQDEEPVGIEPLFNRGVLMLTDAHTYHGFKKMSLPPGVTRKSIATYAYEVIPEGSVTARTTGWAPEQGNAFKRTIVRGITTPWSRPRPESSAARQPRIVSLKPSAAKGLRPRDADSADDSPAHPVDNGQVLTGGFIS